MEFLRIFWDLVIESAPWLLMGYLLAGIIRQVIPSSWVEKQLAEEQAELEKQRAIMEFDPAHLY